MLVRHASPSDVKAITAILNREIAEGDAHFGARAVSESSVASELDSALQGVRFDPDDPKTTPPFVAHYPWLVATESETGPVLGFARAGAWKTRECYARSTEIGVYVLPSHQGRGIGRMLYQQLFPLLRQQGFRTVLAGIALPNTPSVRLHESFGMKHVGTLPMVGFKHGRWRDVGYWTLTFSDAT